MTASLIWSVLRFFSSIFKHRDSSYSLILFTRRRYQRDAGFVGGQRRISRAFTSKQSIRSSLQLVAQERSSDDIISVTSPTQPRHCGFRPVCNHFSAVKQKIREGKILHLAIIAGFGLKPDHGYGMRLLFVRSGRVFSVSQRMERSCDLPFVIRCLVSC